MTRRLKSVDREMAESRDRQPPEAPLEMPVQTLEQSLSGQRPRRVGKDAKRARLVIFGGTLCLSGLLVREMSLAIGLGEATPLQWLLVAVFAIASLWIVFPATGALYAFASGLLRRPADGGRQAPRGPSRVVLLMPVYNEDPRLSFSALHAMAEALLTQKDGNRYEVFLLSDSNDPDAIVREVQCYAALKEAFDGRLAVFYRRRLENRAKKAGNIQDFVERWGGRYDFMLVLDADSLMSARAISTMVARIRADKNLALLQSRPALMGAKTPFARLQQFAAALYGPLVARAVALWQGEDGNFWGHNAIIRVDAFAAACGLPDLKGRPPLGGHVMSHDFVEAALLRRAGWSLRMDCDIEGSWEQPPQTLLSFAQRDRRWAQGNLQHLKVVGAKGLSWISRLHLILGIWSYLSSLVWLVLILLGLGLSVQARFVRPEYFPQEFQLFPTWPQFDSQRLIGLFVVSLLILFLPKLLALAEALFVTQRRERFGGAAALTASFFLEVILSALIAPVMMLFQLRHLGEIFSGRDSGWSSGSRNATQAGFLSLLARHRMTLATGVLIAGVAWITAPGLLLWLSPVVCGLLLAPLSDWLGSHPGFEGYLRAKGWLCAPEELRRPAIFLRREEAERAYDGVVTLCGTFETLFLSRQTVLKQAAAAPNPPSPPRGKPDPVRLVADRKLEEAESIEEALGWLSREERLAILSCASRLKRVQALSDGVGKEFQSRSAS